METFKIIHTRKKFLSKDSLFNWLSNYTGIVSASVNYNVFDSVEDGLILETDLFSEGQLDELLPLSAEAIRITNLSKLNK